VSGSTRLQTERKQRVGTVTLGGYVGIAAAAHGFSPRHFGGGNLNVKPFATPIRFVLSQRLI